MTDFGRVPQMNVQDETPKKEEEKIFDKPKEENMSMKVSEPDDKKLKLKQHLAECRKKSIIVRKAKAQEKKLNKKPRGRPRKVKEDTIPPVNIDSLPKPVIEKTLETIPETEVFEQQDQVPVESSTPPPMQELPPSNSNFDIDDLWSKMSLKMDEKFKSFTPQAVPSEPISIPERQMPQQDNFIKYYDEMKSREDKIREDERNKMIAEAQKHKEKVLVGSTNRYFNKMGYSTPPAKPKSETPTENNSWDNLLNPRRKY